MERVEAFPRQARRTLSKKEEGEGMEDEIGMRLTQTVLDCSQWIGNQLKGKPQKAGVCVWLSCSRVRPAAGLTVLERMVGCVGVIDPFFVGLAHSSSLFCGVRRLVLLASKHGLFVSLPQLDGFGFVTWELFFSLFIFWLAGMNQRRIHGYLHTMDEMIP